MVYSYRVQKPRKVLKKFKAESCIGNYVQNIGRYALSLSYTNTNIAMSSPSRTVSSSSRYRDVHTPVFLINRKSLNCSSQHQKQEMGILHSCIFDQQSLLITKLATTTCIYSHGSIKYICQTHTFLTLSSLLPDKNKFFTCCYCFKFSCDICLGREQFQN